MTPSSQMLESPANPGRFIYDVCTGCNSFLGHKVDTHLANNPFIQIIRFKLGLTGKSGKMRHPFQIGTLEDEPGRKVNLEFSEDGPPKIYFPPDITRTKKDEDKEEIQIFLDEKDIDKLPGMVNKMLRRKGRPELDPDEILKDITRYRFKEPTTSHLMSMSMEQYKLAFLKIAYEFTYYCLGPSYLHDATGNEIREAIQDVPINKKWYDRHKIEGQAGLLEEPTPDGILLGNERHQVMLMQYEDRLLCGMVIFNLFQASYLTNGASSYGSKSAFLAVCAAAWRTQLHSGRFLAVTEALRLPKTPHTAQKTSTIGYLTTDHDYRDQGFYGRLLAIDAITGEKHELKDLEK